MPRFFARAFCALAFAAAAIAAPPPILEYKFNETGTTATSTGTNVTALDLRNSSNVLTDLHGAEGTGLLGAGSADRAFNNTAATNMGSAGSGGVAIHAGDLAAIDGLRSFTVSGWFKTESATALTNGARLVTNSAGGAITTGWHFHGDTTAGNVEVAVDGSRLQNAATGFSEVQKWVYFAVTYDGTQTASNVKIYRAYRNAAEAPGGNPAVVLVATLTANQAAVGDDTNALALGNSSGTHPLNKVRPFDGSMDNVRIYGDAATAAGALTLAELETQRIADTQNDTDNDQLPDSWEMLYFNDLDEVATGNTDGDGLNHLAEYNAGTNPTLADTDGDGLSDSAEVLTHLTNPNLADSDGDTLSDGAEVNTHGTNPRAADSDGDTFRDDVELAAGSNPNDAASIPPPAAFNVHLNEFVANSSPRANDPTAPLDLDGDSGDWIEIRNNEAVAVNLARYRLTDDPANITKYTLPSFSIPAGGYALVYASGKNRVVDGVQPHTNFQLSGSGQLILSRPVAGGGNVIVSQLGTLAVPYPSQHRFISYGPPGNSSATAPAYLTTPTPGAANNAAGVITGFVADTTFSVDRGIFSAPFAVTIGCPTPGATIVYTLNGSAPTATNGTQIPPANGTTPPSGVVNISATTLLRARAIKTGLAPSDIDTQTYLFTADVLTQNGPTPSMGVTAGETVTTWGTSGGDLSNISAFSPLTFWGVNPALASDAVVDNRFAPTDLLNIPSVSVVVAWKELFGPSVVSGDGGIYPPATGVAAEGIDRAASFEFLNPDGSVADPNLNAGFQTDGNVHIFGGTSQTRWKSYKLSMRFQCLNDVTQRVYGDAGTNRFDNFILDARINNTWMHPTDANQRARGDFVNDQVVADLQNQVAGRGGFHSRPVHVYLNGMYWGMYSLHEKPDHHFAAAYFGGEDGLWDVFKHSMRPAFTESDPLVNATYANPALAIVKPTAGNPAGNSSVQVNYEAFLDTLGQGYIAPNPTPDLTQQASLDAVAAKLHLDDFIDYMLVNFVAGNQDWSDKNLYASYYRGGGGLWRFHAWDAEHTFRTGTENFITGNGNEVPSPGQPKPIHNALKANPEYRLRFADHIRRHMFNGGAMSVAGMGTAFTARLNEIDSAIRAESARWGHIRASLRVAPNANVPFKKADWLTRKNSLLLNEGNGNSLLQNRWNLVMNTTNGVFRTEGLYPATHAPDFSQHGGSVAANYALAIANPNAGGVIYYTLDGTDPRVTGGAIAPGAQTYAAPVVLAASGTVKARVLFSGVWSALNEAYFAVGTVPAAAANLVVSELNYHPADPSGAEITAGFAEANDFEFVELLNISANTVDLTGCAFTAGITFHFTTAAIRELAPGARLVIAENPAALAFRHGAGLPIAGAFELNTNLGNDGETLTLTAADGTTAIRTFAYNDNEPWPNAADGLGPSLVLNNPLTAPDHTLAINWRASFATHGAPGAADALPRPANLLGDSDGDGFPDLLEYATAGDCTPAATFETLTPGGVPGEYFVFRFRRDRRADGVTLVPELTTDFATWIPGALLYKETEWHADGTATVAYRSTQTRAALGPQAVARLRITATP